MPVVQGGTIIQKNVRSSNYSIFFTNVKLQGLENEGTEEGTNKEVDMKKFLAITMTLTFCCGVSFVVMLTGTVPFIPALAAVLSLGMLSIVSAAITVSSAENAFSGGYYYPNDC